MPTFADNGWAGLDGRPTSANPEEQAEERRDLDRDLLALFQGGRGRRVLQWMRQVTIEASGPHPMLTHIGFSFQDQLIYREGQRDLVRRRKVAALQRHEVVLLVVQGHL